MGSMKNPRDIVLVGAGFLLGSVFCYFLMAARLVEPKSGNVTVVYSPASQAANLPGPREANPRPRKADGVWREEPTVTFRTHSRYVPARRVNSMFRANAPGGIAAELVPQYDLIDFNYVPDFKLPAE